jgi:hypothetical protein
MIQVSPVEGRNFAGNLARRAKKVASRRFRHAGRAASRLLVQRPRVGRVALPRGPVDLAASDPGGPLREDRFAEHRPRSVADGGARRGKHYKPKESPSPGGR